MRHLFSYLLILLFMVPCAYATEGQTTLVVTYPKSDVVERFESEHPDVVISSAAVVFSSAEDLITRLLTKDSTVDLYIINVSDGLALLKDKGYLPVIQSASIAHEIGGWYPVIRDCVMSDEGIVAVPFDITTGEWQLNEALWAEKCPHLKLETWEDFFNLILWWQNDPDFAEEFNVSINGLGQTQVASEMLYAYVQTYESSDAPLNFDTLAFRQTLEAVTHLDPILIDEDEDEEEWNNMINRPTLLKTNTSDQYGSSAIYHEWSRIPMPAFEEGGKRCIYGDLSMYVINPYSQHKQEAEWYLEVMLASMPDNERIRFSPAVIAPLETSGWQHTYDLFTEELSQIEIDLLDAPPEDRWKLEDRREYLINWFSAESATDRWLVTVEEQTRYSELVNEHLVLSEKSLFLGIHNMEGFLELERIVNRFLQGNITLDECIQALNTVATMLFYEQ